MTNARSINVRRLRMVPQPKHSVRGVAGLVLVLVSVTVPVRAPRAQDSTAVGKDMHRAQVLAELGRFDQAVEVLRKVIAADSHNVAAVERIGATYALHGQIPEAMAAWRRALELNPHLMSAHTNLGNAFADMGEHDSAIAEHRVVIALDSTKSTGYVDLGSGRGRDHAVQAGHRTGSTRCARLVQSRRLFLPPEAVVGGLRCGTRGLGLGSVLLGAVGTHGVDVGPRFE